MGIGIFHGQCVIVTTTNLKTAKPPPELEQWLFLILIQPGEVVLIMFEKPPAEQHPRNTFAKLIAARLLRYDQPLPRPPQVWKSIQAIDERPNHTNGQKTGA